MRFVGIRQHAQTTADLMTPNAFSHMALFVLTADFSGQRVDPLLKKVMSKVFTDKVMNDTVTAFGEIKAEGQGLTANADLSEEEIRD